jgi:hypothetical protein
MFSCRTRGFSPSCHSKRIEEGGEFIARVTSHIPNKGQVTVRYFGLYANAHRGKGRKSEERAGKLVIIEEECPKIPRRGFLARHEQFQTALDLSLSRGQYFLTMAFMWHILGARESASRSRSESGRRSSLSYNIFPSEGNISQD